MRTLLSAFLLAALVAGCGAVGDEPTPPAQGPPPLEHAEDGNLTLYVSNQSFDRPEVDIRVFIDGRLAVEDDFAVEGQHNWIEFRFRVDDGEHTLRAESVTGDTVLEKRFRVRGKRWAVLDYWCCEDGGANFTFDVYNEPVAFA